MWIEFDNERIPVLRLLLVPIVFFAAGDVVLTLLQTAGVSVPEMAFLSLDLGIEGGVPTFYSSAQLMLAAGLLGVIWARKAAKGDRQRWGWMLLTLGFVFLSLDELASLHEEWGSLARGTVRREGFFRFRWIAVALALLPLVTVVFLPLLRSLPARFRRDFIVAGAIFIGSAVLLEGLGGMVLTRGGADTVGYNLLNVVENGGEMVGIALFVTALLRYIAAVVPHPHGRRDVAATA
ncbi:MAG: hypothetical protein H7066_07290 [Cytophagaceae bacterium]|nr:hypothetical protein [Gemmatimonadaceae bacterium]